MSSENQKITVNFIDIGRRFFTLDIDPSCKIRDIKLMLKDRVDDYDISKFSIKLGDLYIDEEKSIEFYENLRNDLDMDEYNYRIETDDSNTNLVKFKFKFGDSDQIYFNFYLNDKVSSIKNILSKNALLKFEDYNSIALFYKSKRELEDNIAIRCVGIPKDEPIIVKSISYEYSVILPDGSALVFAMKKRCRAFDLKKRIIQVYTKEEIKVTDFSLEINGNILQNDSDLFYEKIRKDQLILVVMKHIKSSQNSTAAEPRKRRNIGSLPLKRKSSILFAQQIGTNEQFEAFKFIRQNCDGKIISFKDIKNKISSDVTVYGYITFDYHSNLLSAEIPYNCSVYDAKTILTETYFKPICSHIKSSMVKINSNFGDKKELTDHEILEIQSTSKKPIYSIRLCINFNIKIKNTKIQKHFDFYPNFSIIFDVIKKEILKINPRYTEFRLFYLNKKLTKHSHFKVPPNGVITVDIIEKMSELTTVYFEIPNKESFSLEFNEATPISDVCEAIIKSHKITDEVNLIFAGRILEKDSILQDINLSLITKENPIVIYIQHSLKSIMKMLTE
ncbi:hypothetical protein M9Y10_021617 [Tritrichomonas musculus]|uniref:Ubiquitin-like domain-containing protein n=1 Tax=Tritrichomonas musculus TaxID=1915356 RepID=A0ABR2KQ77_9EUKA